MKQTNTLIFIFLIILLGSITSCKTKKSLIKAPLKEEGPEFLFGELKEKEFKFQTFEARFNIDYNENVRYLDFKGQIRIVKDSVIWISFNQDLGIEIARLLITADTVKYMDRFNKKYLITDYVFINNFLNTSIDFGILQSIILGNDFEYYDRAKFKTSVDGELYKLSTGGRSKLKKYVRNSNDAERIFLQSMWLNPETFKIIQLKMKELTKDSKKLVADYSDFENIDGQLFPTKINYLVEAEDAIKVKVHYNRIVLNQKMNFPFKIPSRYSPTN